MNCGEKIRQIRRERGMTLKDFGKVFGVGLTTVSNWEQGLNRPNVRTIKKIANFAEIPIDELDEELQKTTDLGRKIRQIRLSKGMTLEQFGKLFGASKGNVLAWEKGRSAPNPERLKTIAKLADMTVEELQSPIVNFYTLQDKLKQYSNEPMLPFYKSNYLNKLVDELKRAMITENTEKEMRLIGAITRELMQHCLKNGLEFEVCLAMAMEPLEKR